jgi:hypothetical protein
MAGGGLFGGLFGAGGADRGCRWLQAMPTPSRAGPGGRAGWAAAGSGEVVTAAADASLFDLDALGQAAARTKPGAPGP